MYGLQLELLVKESPDDLWSFGLDKGTMIYVNNHSTYTSSLDGFDFLIHFEIFH
jgi:hypothetical protein